MPGLMTSHKVNQKWSLMLYTSESHLTIEERCGSQNNITVLKALVREEAYARFDDYHMIN